MMGHPTVLVKPKLDLYFSRILEYTLVLENQSILVNKCVIAYQQMYDTAKFLKKIRSALSCYFLNQNVVSVYLRFLNYTAHFVAFKCCF